MYYNTQDQPVLQDDRTYTQIMAIDGRYVERVWDVLPDIDLDTNGEAEEHCDWDNPAEDIDLGPIEA